MEYFPVLIEKVKEMPMAHNEFFLQCGLLLRLEFIPLLDGLQWSQNTSEMWKDGENVFEVGMAAFGSRTIWGDDFTQAITIKLNNIISDKNAHIKVLQIKSTKRSKLYLLPVATSGWLELQAAEGVAVASENWHF